MPGYTGNTCVADIEMDGHCAEQPRIQQQFADYQQGRMRSGREEAAEGGATVRGALLCAGGGQGKVEYENALETRQQKVGRFETETNFLETGQAGMKILSLKLDQISGTTTTLNSGLASQACTRALRVARRVLNKATKPSTSHEIRISVACLHEEQGNKNQIIDTTTIEVGIKEFKNYDMLLT
ncbi:hypothetical protein FIBSPDRAFT_953446 [Athelia psychrophila]|uniref:Uncharacterized protein n=1 Tax=Athelia psychrophila TaxID=1759441 RepID=A0A166K9R2_9AGAM|nr:hypothetical protein FIBSPDRAFT_953446 [Fibularhizoctonia sp. CBS 109695]